jgi:hypothetical protein
MQTTQSILNQRLDTIDKIRVYFFESKVEGALDVVLHKAVVDIHKLFDFPKCKYTHCALQFGDLVYEVSLKGTTVYEYTDELLELEELQAYYEIDIASMTNERKYLVQLTLDSYVTENRKLEVAKGIKYVYSWLTSGSKEEDVHLYDLNISRGTLKRLETTLGVDGFEFQALALKYNPPYTCATMVATVFNQMFEIEPSFDSFLPNAVYGGLMVLASFDFGAMYYVDEGV